MKQTKLLSVLTLSAALLTPLPSWAGDDSDDVAVQNQSLRQQLATLQEQVAILERKTELAEEAAEKRKKENPTFSISDKGFKFQSADKKFDLRIGGLVQLDYRNYLDSDSANDSFLLRRVRPYVEGKVYDKISFKIMPELTGSGSAAAPGATTGTAFTLLDAYANVNFVDEVQGKVGLWKSVVDLERNQSGSAIIFTERGFPTGLAVNRQLGAALNGKFLDGILTYEAGIFNGATDGDSANALSNSDLSSSKEFEGKIFAFPFKDSSWVYVQDAGIGFAGGVGDRDNVALSTSVGDYVTPGQQVLFSYTPATGSVVANGSTYRIAPQAYWYYGGFGLQGEYILSSQTLSKRSAAGAGNTPNNVLNTTTFENQAWQVQGSYVFGADNTFKMVKPKKDFDFFRGEGWGALQVAARYGQIRLDGGAFDNNVNRAYANANTSAKGADSFGVALNWYWNVNFKVVVDYNRTEFQYARGANPAYNSPIAADENALFTRFQVNF